MLVSHRPGEMKLSSAISAFFTFSATSAIVAFSAVTVSPPPQAASSRSSAPPVTAAPIALACRICPSRLIDANLAGGGMEGQ